MEGNEDGHEFRVGQNFSCFDFFGNSLVFEMRK